MLPSRTGNMHGQRTLRSRLPSFSPRKAFTAVATLVVLSTAIQPSEAAAAAGQYEIIAKDSLASAQMMGLINEDYVFILDKVQNNPAKLPDGKPVWGSILKLSDNSVQAIEVNTNTFCASGVTLGNGSWIVAGGNSANGLGDADGRSALRIMEPVANGSDESEIAWVDNPGVLNMQSQRWYPGAENLADGSMVLVGGATNGGYINRNLPNPDPAFEGPGGGSLDNINGGANPSFEFFPRKGELQTSAFTVNTSGLNMYPHMFLMPSGNIFMQANFSAALWNYTANTETYLPDMPDKVIRVYPASGAAAMLPLTPANNYTPTLIFCGGSNNFTDEGWGDYLSPRQNPLTSPASDDCSSITPENADGSLSGADWVREDKLPAGRTMGQFIHLPTGQLVVINGAAIGTAGYGNVSTDWQDGTTNLTWTNILPNGIGTEGMSQDPQYTPVLYDPEQSAGSRLSQEGFGSSTIARLYHSSALLLPDGAVLVGGSSPHADVALNMPQDTTPQGYNTTYEIEKWYPSYYFKERPVPEGLPSYILYGGDTWSFKLNSTYTGSDPDSVAKNTKIMVIRPGFSTHAMNMGQRSLQLQHAFAVQENGDVEYTVMPMPPNANLFAPGPALLFVTVDGVPSKGKHIMIGQEQFGGAVPKTYSVGAVPTLSPSTAGNSTSRIAH